MAKNSRKRKLNTPAAVAKRARGNEPEPQPEPEPVEPDFSQLPTELLLKIVGYLKKEDKAMAPLSQTCTRFHDICSPRLELVLDFHGRGEDVQMEGEYKDIKIITSEIENDENKIKMLLKSSKRTATSLTIEPAKNRYGSNYGCSCKVLLRTLLYILRRLPNLTSIKLRGVQAFEPRLSFNKIIDDEIPVLDHLKVLTIEDCLGTVLNCFKKTTSIEELKIFGQIKGAYVTTSREIILKQTKLKVLRHIIGDIKNRRNFDELRSLEVPLESAHHLNQAKSIYEISPNLENLTLHRCRYDSLRHLHRLTFLMNRPKVSLRSIVVDGNVDRSINMDRIFENFPNLQKFKSKNIKWKIGRQIEYIEIPDHHFPVQGLMIF